MGGKYTHPLRRVLSYSILLSVQRLTDVDPERNAELELDGEFVARVYKLRVNKIWYKELSPRKSRSKRYRPINLAQVRDYGKRIGPTYYNSRMVHGYAQYLIRRLIFTIITERATLQCTALKITAGVLIVLLNAGVQFHCILVLYKIS